MNANSRSKSAPRAGAAFLILVVMILLVIVGATRTLVRSELGLRRDHVAQVRARAMRTAIEAVRLAGIESSQPVRFPLDDDSQQHIELQVQPDSSAITARWFKGQKVIDEMTQTAPIKAESDE